MRRLLLAVLLLGTACGDDQQACDPTLPVKLTCPTAVDLGCAGATGATAVYSVTASSCSDPHPVVACAPVNSRANASARARCRSGSTYSMRSLSLLTT